MLRIYKWVWGLSIFLLACGGGNRSKVFDYEYSNYYNPDRTRTSSKLLQEKDSIEIFLSFKNPLLFQNVSEKDFIRSYNFTYKIIPDLNRSQSLLADSIKLHSIPIYKYDNAFYFSFKIPALDSYPNAQIVLKKHDYLRKRTETTTIDLNIKNNSKSSFILTNKSSVPFLNNYISVDDTVIILNRKQDPLVYTLTFLNNEFQAAQAPYKSSGNKKSTHISADTSSKVAGNELFNFTRKGLYIIKEDQSEAGVPFVITDKNFPNISKAEELIGPLVYILNPNEFEKVKQSRDLKIAADSFWLKTGGSPEYSKFLIKSYYEKVEYSNQTFTSFKEGWKTDRGMIYIVFGKPDQVFKTEKGEDWVYNNILSRIVSFSFIKKETLFLNKDYELVRRPDYEKYWNSAIEKWRNGIITK